MRTTRREAAASGLPDSYLNTIDRMLVTAGAAQDHMQLVERYLHRFPLRLSPWHEQIRYVPGDRNVFRAVSRPLSASDVMAHVDHGQRYWIGCRAPGPEGRPWTKFLVLDFDAKQGTPRSVAWDRARAVRDRFGAEMEPLCFATPGGGIHLLWFLDGITAIGDLVDPGAPKSRGLVLDIARDVLGSVGDGVCEVYPQAGSVLRWPLGTDQYLLDPTTGERAPGMDSFAALLDYADQHQASVPCLSVEHLRSIAPKRASSGVPRVPHRPVSTAAPHVRGDTVTRIHPMTLHYVLQLYRDGLTRPSTRHQAMFNIARVMVHAPQELVDLGYRLEGDPAEQLFAWLDTKHNGLSAEYRGGPDVDRERWMRRCQEIVRDAGKARGGGAGSLPPGSLSLTTTEWDVVFALGDQHGEHKLPRHRVELVASAWTWRAKWSVQARQRQPEQDGTYVADIKAEWVRQIPFAKRSDAAKRYRARLEELGHFSLVRRGHPARAKANEYAGFRLEFGGAPRPLPAPVEVLKGIAPLLGLDPSEVMYCIEAHARFSDGNRLVERYGRSGADYIQRNVDAIMAGISGARRFATCQRDEPSPGSAIAAATWDAAA